MIAAVFLAIILAGIGQLIVFIIRKCRKKPLIAIQEKLKSFPLSEEKASQILFLAAAFLSITYSLPALLYKLGWLISAELIIGLNLLLQLAVAILIYNSLKPKELGFSFQRKYTFLAVRIYSATLPLLIVSALVNQFLAENLGIPQQLNPALELLFFLKSKTSIGLVILQIVALGPLTEELFFRGFIYKMVRSRYRFLGSATTVSLIFSLLHRDPYNILPIFILSFSLCYLYEKSQNIYPCFLFHSIFNTVSLSFFLSIKELL